MLKINDVEYKEYTTKVSWGSFSVTSQGKTRTGIAPFITFNSNDTIFIGLELTFSDEMFKNCQIDTENNITKYLSDISFEDEKGWISLITGKYNLDITRINEDSFKFNLLVEEDDIKVYIDDIVKVLA